MSTITLTHIAMWLAAMMAWRIPPSAGMTTNAAYIADRETRDERLARYQEIAQAAAEVAYDPAETPLYAGPYARARTATELLGIAGEESGWHRGVDDGTRRGDHGKAWCLGQVHPRAGEPSGEELAADRSLCFRLVLHRARESWTFCAGIDGGELVRYVGGRCSSSSALAKSRARLEMGDALFRHQRPPAPDAEVMRQLAALPLLPPHSRAEKTTRADP